MDYIPFGMIYPFSLSLEAAAGGSLQANPTLAAGDIKVYSSADSSGSNLDTIPSVDPAAGVVVRGTLSVAETTSDHPQIVFIDAAGGEWLPRTMQFETMPPEIFGIATQFTASAGGASTVTAPGGIIVVDNDYQNCRVKIIWGTGKGQVRTISASTASSGVITVSSSWGTQPDNTSVVDIFLAGVTATFPSVNVGEWNGTAVATPDTAGYPVVTVKSGTGSGEINLNSGVADAQVKGIDADAITAAAIADAAIDNATFAADVGSTAFASNPVAQAADKALVNEKLDHLVAVAESGDVVNSSIVAKLASKSATPAFASYDNTTDSLEANRDNLGTAGAGLTAVGGLGTGAITSGSFAAGAINAAAVADNAIDAGAIATGAITNAKFAAGAIDAAAIATGAIDADAIAADALLAIADSLLKRDFSAVTGESARSMLNAMRKLMNKMTVVANTLTVYKENDTTPAFTQAVTTSASAEAIVALDTN